MISHLPDREQIATLSGSEFGRLQPKGDQPLCLPSFKGGEFDRDFREALNYVRQLLRGPLRDEIGSPIFHFAVEEDMSRLSEGAMKWVGIIPREMKPEETQDFAIQAALSLAESESTRLKLEGEDTNKLRELIRNTLISVLHYHLKAAPDTLSLNMTLNGEKNFISHRQLEEKVKQISEALDEKGEEINTVDYDKALIQMLKELGAIPENAHHNEAMKVLQVLNQAKSEAWNLYYKLGDNIEAAQEKASIRGPLAGVDLDEDHSSLHLMEHLRAMYGLSERYGRNEADRYELQISAHLTWLLARLTTHPVYKNLIQNQDKVRRDFMDRLYHEEDLFKRNEDTKVIYLDERMRPTSKEGHHKSMGMQVYDSQLDGFEDLPTEARQVYRGRFRPKDKTAILVKAVKERQELSHISDALAGEAVMTGINEKDLDPKKNPNAHRLTEYMVAQAEAIAEGIAKSMGLSKAPEGMSYKKIPRGTYKVVPKLVTEEKENGHSFNFPALKIYFNIPTDETDDPEGASVRTEFRLICCDTWIRSNKQKDSMSHHETYKMKQGVDLLDTFTARLYNEDIHPVANKFREWCKEKEQAELAEIAELQAA